MGMATGVGAALSVANVKATESVDMPEFKQLGRAIRVKPVLMYHLHPGKEAVTWREWGGLKTEQDVTEEIARINQELSRLRSRVDFPLEIMPLTKVNTDATAKRTCESDMVVIPSGILLRYISGKPSFLNDPCYPYNGIATCAHCSAPRRMNGKTFEPTHIYTHCESDYGAAPKVDFQKGQVITNLIPDFESKKWLGFRISIKDHPFYDICRSQFDCTIDGDWKTLQQDMRGFHWMTCYGDYLNEVGYVLNKVGIGFKNIST